MSDDWHGAGVPLKKRPFEKHRHVEEEREEHKVLRERSNNRNNSSHKTEDEDVISIADDTDADDSSFSSSSSSLIDLMKCPTIGDESSCSPGLNTQPAFSSSRITNNRKRPSPTPRSAIKSPPPTTTNNRVKEKKRKVSMSLTDSLAKVTGSMTAAENNLNSRSDISSKKGEFRLTKSSSKKNITNNTLPEKKATTTKEEKKKRKSGKATQKEEEQLSSTLTTTKHSKPAPTKKKTTTKRSSLEDLLAEDSDDDDDLLLPLGPRIPRKKLKETKVEGTDNEIVNTAAASAAPPPPPPSSKASTTTTRTTASKSYATVVSSKEDQSLKAKGAKKRPTTTQSNSNSAFPEEEQSPSKPKKNSLVDKEKRIGPANKEGFHDASSSHVSLIAEKVKLKKRVQAETTLPPDESTVKTLKEIAEKVKMKKKVQAESVAIRKAATDTITLDQQKQPSTAACGKVSMPTGARTSKGNGKANSFYLKAQNSSAGIPTEKNQEDQNGDSMICNTAFDKKVLEDAAGAHSKRQASGKMLESGVTGSKSTEHNCPASKAPTKKSITQSKKNNAQPKADELGGNSPLQQVPNEETIKSSPTVAGSKKVLPAKDGTKNKTESVNAPAKEGTKNKTESVNAPAKEGTKNKTESVNGSKSKSLNPERPTKKSTASATRNKSPKTVVTSSKTNAKPKVAKAKAKPKKKRFDQQILHHMVMSMKPFSLRCLAQEMKTTEQQLFNTLLAMKDKKLVFEKEFVSAKGRSKTLIWANLEAKEAAQSEYTPERAAAVKEEIQGLVQQERDLQQQLANVSALPSNENLRSQLESEEVVVAQLRQRLEETKGRIESVKAQTEPQPKCIGWPRTKSKSSAQLARERCPRRLKMKINAMRSEWKNRKDKCRDFVETLADAMEKKPKDIYKMLDLEIDEAVGAVMPAKHNV